MNIILSVTVHLRVLELFIATNRSESKFLVKAVHVN
jgi:hypothetical protein